MPPQQTTLWCIPDAESVGSSIVKFVKLSVIRYSARSLSSALTPVPMPLELGQTVGTMELAAEFCNAQLFAVPPVTSPSEAIAKAVVDPFPDTLPSIRTPPSNLQAPASTHKAHELVIVILVPAATLFSIYNEAASVVVTLASEAAKVGRPILILGHDATVAEAALPASV